TSRRVRPGPAGRGAAVRGAPVAAHGRALSSPRAVAGPGAGEDVRGLAGMAARLRRAAAGAVRGRRLALGGRVHPGVPGAVPCRGPAPPGPDHSHLSPGVPDVLDCGRSRDTPGAEPPDAPPGRRDDAAEVGG